MDRPGVSKGKFDPDKYDFSLGKCIPDPENPKKCYKGPNGKRVMPDAVNYRTHTIIELKPVPKSYKGQPNGVILDYLKNHPEYGPQLQKYVDAYRRARGAEPNFLFLWYFRE